MKYDISSMIIGLTVHWIPKHNHFTGYNQNKILYYSVLKCSNMIFQVFHVDRRFSDTSRLLNEKLPGWIKKQ